MKKNSLAFEFGYTAAQLNDVWPIMANIGNHLPLLGMPEVEEKFKVLIEKYREICAGFNTGLSKAMEDERIAVGQ